jgi:hypothetical protein
MLSGFRLARAGLVVAAVCGVGRALWPIPARADEVINKAMRTMSRPYGVVTGYWSKKAAAKLGGRTAQMVWARLSPLGPVGSSAQPHQCPPPVSPVSPKSVRYWILLLGTAIQRPWTNIRTPSGVTR